MIHPAFLLVALLLGAGPLPAEVESAREAVQRLDASRAAALARRDRLEARLDALGEDIAERKASTGRLPDGPLADRLQDAQALSVEIDRLTREIAETTGRLRATARRLLAAYDRALVEARAAVDPSRGEAPLREALARVARLEAERRQVIADLARLEPLPVAPPQAVLPPPEASAARLAMADRMRDEADRLRRRLETVTRAREALEAQAALEAEMRGFLSEGSLFDEEDTSLPRVTAEGAGAPPSGTPTAGAPTGDAAQEDAPPAGTPAFRLERVPEPEALDALLEPDALPADSLPALLKQEAALRQRIEGLEARADRIDREEAP